MIYGAWLAWWLLAVWCIVGLASWFRGPREVLAPLPIFLVTVGLYALPRAAYLLWFDKAPDSSGGLLYPDQLQLLIRTLVTVIAGVVAFLAGHASKTAGRTGRSVRLDIPHPDPTRALMVGIGCMGLGLTSLAVLIQQMGGLSHVLESQGSVIRLLEGKGILLNLTRLLLIPIGLLLYDHARRRTRLAVWLLVVFSIACYATLGRRSLIAFALAYPLLLYHWSVRPFPQFRILVFASMTAIALIGYSYVRVLGSDRVNDAVRLVHARPAVLAHFVFSTGEFRIFDAMTIVIRDVPEISSPTFGSTFVRIPFWVIPRTLWTTKPVTLGEMLVAQHLPHVRAGRPPMVFGELHAAGGFFAVLLGLYALGWCARAVWEWARRHRNPGTASLYILFCYFVYDATRVGDPSRTLWALLLGALFFIGAFGLAAPVAHRRQRHE